MTGFNTATSSGGISLWPVTPMVKYKGVGQIGDFLIAVVCNKYRYVYVILKLNVKKWGGVKYAGHRV